MTELKPLGGTDFIRAEPPHGFGMQFYVDTEGRVSGTVQLDEGKQGPPGHAHGGALIALLDEAMGAAAWNQNYRVVAVNLQFNLKRGVPLNTDITVTGQVERKDGRKVYCTGTVLLPDGTIAVEGEGLFLEAPQYAGGPSETYNPFLIGDGDE